MGHFSRSLAQIRAIHGYRTAYSFYHSNGGRRVFPFTYGYYKKIERGESLPRPAWLAQIIKFLRAQPSIGEHARIVRDYLRDLSGDDDSYDCLFAPLLRVPETAPSEQMLGAMRGRLAYHVAPVQYRVIVSTLEACGCFMLLANTSGAVDDDEIAAALRSPKSRCLEALRSLRRIGLVKPHKNAHASRFVGRNFTLPEDKESQSLREKMRAHLDEIARRGGKTLHNSGAVVRLEQTAIDSAARNLRGALAPSLGCDLSHLGAETDTSVCLIETRIRRIF